MQSGHDKKLSMANILTEISSAAIAGGIEQIIFQPIDTGLLRIQSDKSTTYHSSLKQKFLHNAKIFFTANPGLYAKPKYDIKSLYDGLPISLVYKVLQRSYRLAGEKTLSLLIENSLGHYFGDENYIKVVQAGFSGAMIGLIEAPLFNQIDAIKVRFQTNKKSVENVKAITLFNPKNKEFNVALGTTIFRNVIGSSVLFSSKALSSMWLDSVHAWLSAKSLATNKHEYEWQKNALSSFIASELSIVVSSPMDVVKTRIQCGKEQEIRPLAIAKTMLQREGVKSFFKGNILRMLFTGPKLAFAMVMTDVISESIQRKTIER